jgi:hypothetical protein
MRHRVFKYLAVLVTIALFTETVSSKFYEYGRRPIYKVSKQVVKNHMEKRFYHTDFAHVEAFRPVVRASRVQAIEVPVAAPAITSTYFSLHLLRSPPTATLANF